MKNFLIICLIFSGFLMAIVITLFFRVKYLEAKAKNLEATLSLQNASINEWKRQSEIAQNKILDISKKAEDILKNDTTLKDIDQQTIPKDCLGAVKWGAIKAGSIS